MNTYLECGSKSLYVGGIKLPLLHTRPLPSQHGLRTSRTNCNIDDHYYTKKQRKLSECCLAIPRKLNWNKSVAWCVAFWPAQGFFHWSGIKNANAKFLENCANNWSWMNATCKITKILARNTLLPVHLALGMSSIWH